MLIEQDIAFAQRPVSDIMAKEVITIASDMPLAEAARFMWEREISGAPVVDHDGLPVGVVSASDIVRAQGFGTRREGMVSDIMTHGTFSVRRNTTLAELARFLSKSNVHRALVVDDGELVGIVSMSDIVREVGELDRIEV